MSTSYELRVAVDQADADLAAIDADLATLDAGAEAFAADMSRRGADAVQTATSETTSLGAKHAALHSKALAVLTARRNGPRIELKRGEHAARLQAEAQQRSTAEHAERTACLDRLQAALASLAADGKAEHKRYERRRAELVARRDALIAYRAERQEQYERASNAWRGGQW